MEPGESQAGITVPEGDPEALRELGRSFGAIGSGLAEAAGSFGALPGELSEWRGPASVAFAATAGESNRAAYEAAVAFALKQQAAELLAEELEAVQQQANDAIDEAKDAERRIDAAEADIDEARQAREEALERAAAADLVAAGSDVVGPASLGALADRERALDDAERAAERAQAAQRRLQRAEEELEQAQRRGRRLEERAQELSEDASRTITAVAPANVLAALGGPFAGIGGMPPLSPLAGMVPVSMPLGGGRENEDFGDLSDFPMLLPLLKLIPDRDRLRDIEREYQVETDNVVGWEPPFPFSLRTEPQDVTRTEADLLDGLSVLSLRTLDGIRNDASETALERFPDSGENDGHVDAFRHTYANALLAREFGDDFTKRFTTAHEASPKNPSGREAMDLHNNEVGRRIAAENPDADEDELAELVQRAVEDGEVVVIDGELRLAFSDQVPPGQTGELPEPDKDAPERGGRPLDPVEKGYDEGYDEGYDPGYGKGYDTGGVGS